MKAQNIKHKNNYKNLENETQSLTNNNDNLKDAFHLGLQDL